MNLNPADLNISDTLSNLAKIMHDYLKIFQTDRPMVPFIADELEKQMRKIMDIVLKRSVLSETPTPYTLIKLDLDSEKNLLPADNINIGIDLKEMMKSLSLKQEEKRKFLRECKLSAIALLKKMQERSPLKTQFVGMHHLFLQTRWLLKRMLVY